MVLISPNIALFVFLVIIVVAAIIAWAMGTYGEYDKHPIHSFMSILAGLAILVTFLLYYNLIQIQAQQQNLVIVDEISKLNDSLLSRLMLLINKAARKIPGFVSSITPLTRCGDSIVDELNAENCTQKTVLSQSIFAIWQEVVIESSIISFEALPINSNFLQRANSKQLFEQWELIKINFNGKTQDYGNLIFEYALPITIQTPEEYVKVATLLIADPRYKAIF